MTVGRGAKGLEKRGKMVSRRTERVGRVVIMTPLPTEQCSRIGA